MEVASALALTGQTLLGQSVMVKASEAEKNMAWEAQQATAAQQASAAQQAGMNPLMMGTGPCKLMVTNIHPNVGVCYPQDRQAPLFHKDGS